VPVYILCISVTLWDIPSSTAVCDFSVTVIFPMKKTLM